MKSTSAVLVVAALSLGLSSLAIPAHAAPPALPDGDHLVTASCNDTEVTFHTVDAQTGAVTAVGAGNEGYECAYQGAWDATTQTFFATIWDSENDSRLVVFDTTTGGLTEVGPVVDEADEPVNVYSMVIGLDGKAYFNNYDQLYSLDLLTAKATLLGTLDAVDSPAYGFSVDPTTGKLYLLAESGDLFVIDPVAVTATLVGTWPVSEGAQYSYGISIDHAGTAWVVEYPGEESYSALWSTPLATFGVDPQRSGNIVSAEGDDPTMWWVALTYAAAPAPAPAPEPVLAATGFDAAPLALGGLLLAAAGIVLVGRRSRRAA